MVMYLFVLRLYLILMLALAFLAEVLWFPLVIVGCESRWLKLAQVHVK
jgi:hypothetical protein